MVQWLRLCAANTMDWGSIPGQGTRYHMPQRRVWMLQLWLKILSAVTKPWCSQINEHLKKKRNKENFPTRQRGTWNLPASPWGMYPSVWLCGFSCPGAVSSSCGQRGRPENLRKPGQVSSTEPGPQTRLTPSPGCQRSPIQPPGKLCLKRVVPGWSLASLSALGFPATLARWGVSCPLLAQEGGADLTSSPYLTGRLLVSGAGVPGRRQGCWGPGPALYPRPSAWVSFYRFILLACFFLGFFLVFLHFKIVYKWFCCLRFRHTCLAHLSFWVFLFFFLLGHIV